MLDRLLIEAVKARLAPLMVSEMPYGGGKVYPTEQHLTRISEAAIEAIDQHRNKGSGTTDEKGRPMTYWGGNPIQKRE